MAKFLLNMPRIRAGLKPIDGVSVPKAVWRGLTGRPLWRRFLAYLHSNGIDARIKHYRLL